MWLLTVRLSDEELAAVHSRIEQRLVDESAEPIELNGTLRLEDGTAKDFRLHLVRTD